MRRTRIQSIERVVNLIIGEKMRTFSLNFHLLLVYILFLSANGSVNSHESNKQKLAQHSIKVARGGQALQQDALELDQELERESRKASVSSAYSSLAPSATATRVQESKGFEEFLENLPIHSVGQKHAARIECELSKEPTKLVWLKLLKGKGADNQTLDDIKLISLNEKIISPDKRYEVRRQSGIKWILTVDKINSNDNQAYFLCQASELSKNKGGFVGGAKLNVLVPPRIIENETSPSLVQVTNEFEPISLRCKVVSEPQSHLFWKREDGKSLDNLAITLKHQTERRSSSQILSIDSSELIFSSLLRNQTGAYLCIASNGVQPGVSQRMNLVVLNCRSSPNFSPTDPSEPCQSDSSQGQQGSTNNSSLLPPPIEPDAGQQKGARRNWKLSSAKSSNTKLQRQPTTDKRRADQAAGQVSIKQAVVELPSNRSNGFKPQLTLILSPIVLLVILLHLTGNSNSNNNNIITVGPH